MAIQSQSAGSAMNPAYATHQNRLLSLQTAQNLLIAWLPIAGSKFTDAEELSLAVVGMAAQFEDYIANGSKMPEEK